MAENNNNSNDNGGADDEILAAIQSHITKAKSSEACYVFGDVIKDPMKAIYGDKWRAVVAKKSYNDADAFVRMSFPAGPGKYSYPSVEAGKAYLMAKTTKHGAPYCSSGRRPPRPPPRRSRAGASGVLPPQCRGPGDLTRRSTSLRRSGS